MEDEALTQRVGVALSGGGHRASLWAVGVLQYLADAKASRDVVSIASVSGGSLTNAFVGQQVDFNSVDGPAFETEVTTPLMRQIVNHGTFFAPWLTKVYLLFLAVIALAGLVGPWPLSLGWPPRLGLFVLGLLVVSQVFWLRGAVCVRAFRRTLFSPGKKPSKLTALRGTVDHILCATDLQSGDHVYFGRDIVYGYRFGVGGPADLDLATAAHASAALPGAFPPVRLRTARHAFVGAPPTPGVESPPKELVLVDGGVYDNLADQWGSEHEDRETRLPVHYKGRAPDQLIVANASAGMVWSPIGSVRIPLVREVSALLRDKAILYDNTTAHRRVALIDRFDLAERLGAGQRGAYIGIEQSPFRVADQWKDAIAPWQDRATRAQRVLDVLGDTAGMWFERARLDREVGTQLSKMDRDDVARLVHHAYVTAMCNLHVILEYPLLPMPDRSRFEDLVKD